MVSYICLNADRYIVKFRVDKKRSLFVAILLIIAAILLWIGYANYQPANIYLNENVSFFATASQITGLFIVLITAIYIINTSIERSITK